MAPVGPPPGAGATPVTIGPPPRRHTWAPWIAGILTLLVLAALAAAAFIHVPYVIISPGDATPLDAGVLRVDGATTYQHEGDLLFLTVAVSSRDPNLYRYLFAKLDDNASVEKRQEVIGCAGYAESARLSVDQMDQSQDVAKTVALRRLGYEVPDEPGRVQILDVQCDGPSDGRLQLGDVIVSLDGTPVASADEVRPLIVAHAPGDTAVFGVLRDGEHRDVRVELGERDGSAFAGIVTQTDRRHRIPIGVQIDTARVSGPSAGLAFSLAIIDDLTPGDLTGGRDVAVTGTINEDGTVGPVGGVAQKAVTARRVGARLMIVPQDEVKDAKARAGDMKVVGVRTIDDALAALAANGGASIAAPAGAAQ
ncbi:MAG: PDZ domain-containing protein [Acidimicrobiia bacterium]